MLLSRFWYVVLALCLGVAVFVLFVSARLFNRHGERAMAESLASDSSAVGWYLRDDARSRSAALIPIALDPDIRKSLNKISDQDEPKKEERDKVKTALRKVAADVPENLTFTALWAVDANGRVIANVGFDHGTNWELGGFSVVADALHGWIRDDAWVWKERIYRVVARPVELNSGGAPVGAIVGATVVDDRFAAAVSRRTGAAVGFYAAGQRVASYAPEGFDKANLDLITQDLKSLDEDADYQEKGRSEVRILGEHLGVVYARMPGEAWELGAGYAVGRLAVAVDSPMEFLDKADDTDKQALPTLWIGLGVFAAALLGLLFSIFEHTMPLATFRRESMKMAKGEIDVLAPSNFRGVYKKIASDLNDGVEKVAAKGGVPRRAADLEEVLGPIPAKPQMSAFSVPGSEDAPEPSSARPDLPAPPPSSRGAARIRASDPPPARPGGPPRPKPKPMPKPPLRVGGAATGSVEAGPESGRASVEEASAVSSSSLAVDELEDWRRVYEDFLNMKKQCGENTSSLTFEKFKGTLERNKAALVQRHGCSRVKFTVYAKEGKAALKASPVK